MTHPFKDKLFFFVGKPERSTRQAMRDALIAVGGVTDDSLTTFTDYVLAMKGAENTKAYNRALSNERCGLLAILSESQFFDILDGKATPPEKNNTMSGDSADIIPAQNPESIDIELDWIKRDAIEEKRINNLAEYGIPTPEGRLKIDFRNLYKAHRFAEYMKEHYGANSIIEDVCDICGKPATVFISGEQGADLKLCLDCNNSQIAEMTGAAVPSNVPKNITLTDSEGKQHTFKIEVLMFPVGMVLIATEIGETRYKADVFGGLNDDFEALLQSLINQIEAFLSVKYMDKDGYFVGNTAVGYIAYNHERDAHEVVIDGKPYTWQELEKNIAAHEGFRIKIEFADSGDVFD